MDLGSGKSSKSITSFSKELLELIPLFGPLSFLSLSISDKVADSFIKSIMDKLFPNKDQEDSIQIRTQEASNHLSEAARILGQLQSELNDRNQELQMLLTTINDRKDEASHYAELANVNKNTADAFRKETEKILREQLRIEFERDKTKRKIVSAIVWTITLLLGGIVGVLIQKLWDGVPLF